MISSKKIRIKLQPKGTPGDSKHGASGCLFTVSSEQLQVAFATKFGHWIVVWGWRCSRNYFSSPISTSLQISSPALSTVAFSFYISIFFSVSLETCHEPSAGLQLFSLFHRRAFRAELEQHLEGSCQVKRWYQTWFSKGGTRLFFFWRGESWDMWTAVLQHALFWMVQQPSGGPFPFFFLFFFLGMRIIDKWNIPCHGDGWEAYVPRSLI